MCVLQVDAVPMAHLSSISLLVELPFCLFQSDTSCCGSRRRRPHIASVQPSLHGSLVAICPIDTPAFLTESNVERPPRDIIQASSLQEAQSQTIQPAESEDRFGERAK